MKWYNALLFILFLVLIVACGNMQTKESSIKKEYDKKQAELNNSLADMNVPLQKWNSFMTRIKEGSPVYTSDLRDTYNQFHEKAEITKSKISEISEFLDKNKEELVNSSVNVDKTKQELAVISKTIDLNDINMKKEISNMPQQ